jgi:hypothetical protein
MYGPHSRFWVRMFTLCLLSAPSAPSAVNPVYFAGAAAAARVPPPDAGGLAVFAGGAR